MAFNGAPNKPGKRYTTNEKTAKATINLGTPNFSTLSSCGIWNLPNKWRPISVNTAIHIAKKISLSKILQWYVWSTVLKNLSANANSKKPKNTLIVFIQPPDFGIFLSNSGDKANNTNGEASPNPKPNIPMIGLMNLPEAPNPKSVPTNGPVQEKETKAKVNAMKKIPIKPPLSD